MQLKIETFSNARGGNAFFKAVTHPVAARAARRMLDQLPGDSRVAIYDPEGWANALGQLYDISTLKLADEYV
jgi:hypothetical protein